MLFSFTEHLNSFNRDEVFETYFSQFANFLKCFCGFDVISVGFEADELGVN